MDDQRFDAITRMLANGLPRRGALKALASLSVVGAATRASVPEASADGNFGDHCDKSTPCKKPLVCINLECDHCRESGDCQQGWCCEGYTCSTHGCVACSKSRGVTSEGCNSRKKKRRKKKH